MSKLYVHGMKTVSGSKFNIVVKSYPLPVQDINGFEQRNVDPKLKNGSSKCTPVAIITNKSSHSKTEFRHSILLSLGTLSCVHI